MSNADIAVVGLAVMGQNLILNMNDNGYKVVAYNRTTAKVDEFIEGAAKGTQIIGADSISDMLAKLSAPKKIMLMVKAGEVVDAFIEQLVPHLTPGDIIIDGGNSNYTDTNRRVESLGSLGILFVGCGVSGGEEGARTGPSLMPGGNKDAWEFIRPIFTDIAAKTPSGEPCCSWVGHGGAGHFVKMVHNGIEYGDMQLICECYQLMKDGLKLSNEQMSAILKQWNQTDLNSYLIEITADILQYKDDEGYVLDRILDTAGQKGTGKWTGITALDYGMPLSLITESVFARCLSAQKSMRVKASELYKDQQVCPSFIDYSDERIEQIRQALLFAKIISYAQGYLLMREVSDQYGWDLQYGDIALMWRAGCIIRSVFLDKIKQAFDKQPDLENLLFDEYFQGLINDTQQSVREVLSICLTGRVAMPALNAALSFFDGLTTARSPANLLQAQRDYFGAHTYERLDRNRGEFFHTDWIGSNTNIASSSYNV